MSTINLIVRSLAGNMPRTVDMVKEAARKRTLAQEFRQLAETMARDSLRTRVVRQAEQLEAEAASLESIARATRH